MLRSFLYHKKEPGDKVPALSAEEGLSRGYILESKKQRSIKREKHLKRRGIKKQRDIKTEKY